MSPRVHTLATLLVAIGTTLSGFWILALSSWMHTPAGHAIVDGVVHARDWWRIVFNPSFPYRFAHMMVASGLTVAFLVAGLSAYRWRRGDRADDVLPTLRMGVRLAALLIPLQIFLGDLHGLNTLEHQPAKIAAMEAVWQTERGAPLLLFAIPDEETRSNRFAIGIPKGASLILRHDPDAEIVGLDDFQGAHPPVAPVFYGFRLMVGVGLLMLALSWLGAWLLRGGREPPRWLAHALVAMSLSGWVATLAGWYVTEIGRQPWLVTGILTTAEAASKVPAASIGLSLAMYLALYAALVAAYVSVLFYLARHPAAAKSPPVAGAAAATGAT